ncbi:MAG TPA: fluoride efflux transporter CrcB [Acidimicrobiales bacterium]|nr:fluoride efflux transporter CrcB [Acidimicrobiales bacterium]
MRVVLIAVAGAAGALTRYAVASAVGVRAFPWSTLSINVVGSFLLGILLQSAPGRLSDDVRTGLAVGFLGAFTTFSTFSYESVAMIRDGRAAVAALYVVASVISGMAAAAVGWRVGAAL